jgi:hypothetical protein
MSNWCLALYVVGPHLHEKMSRIGNSTEGEGRVMAPRAGQVDSGCWLCNEPWPSFFLEGAALEFKQQGLSEQEPKGRQAKQQGWETGWAERRNQRSKVSAEFRARVKTAGVQVGKGSLIHPIGCKVHIHRSSSGRGTWPMLLETKRTHNLSLLVYLPHKSPHCYSLTIRFIAVGCRIWL